MKAEALRCHSHGLGTHCRAAPLAKTKQHKKRDRREVAHWQSMGSSASASAFRNLFCEKVVPFAAQLKRPEGVPVSMRIKDRDLTATKERKVKDRY